MKNNIYNNIYNNIKGLCLEDLKTGESGIITRVGGHGAFRKRITEMGFVHGKMVKVIKNAPLTDPVQYEIMDYNVSLRRSEARMVEVIPAGHDSKMAEPVFHGTIGAPLPPARNNGSKTIMVALVGNPNSGKTTLYNYASGSHDRVGNYGGVTVEAHEAMLRRSSYTFKIVDLPGTYSLTEYTPEELYVRRHLMESGPDFIINVVDASNLERNLYLTTQLIDMNLPVVMALNMYDELENTGAILDTEALSAMLGIPVIPTVASKGTGIDKLFDVLIELHSNIRRSHKPVFLNYGPVIERSISNLQHLLWKNDDIIRSHFSRYIAIKLLETDTKNSELTSHCSNSEKIKHQCTKEIRKIEAGHFGKSETILTDARYGFIAGLLKATLHPAEKKKRTPTESIDSILTHKIFGFPIFVFFMWLIFQLTFTAGSIPMGWIDSSMAWFGNLIKNSLAESPLRDLLVDGIIGGVGGVIIFLPNILILFFFISFIEDTGYMSRASFIMDKLMNLIGLHGKSFIPLLIGFGCNVPAVMATRTLENKKDRFVTMMLIPFMSCSARLPVYVLLISAFFPRYKSLILISIYLAGVMLSILVALFMSKTFFARQQIPFIMELPPYRMPTLKNTIAHMWQKGIQYLKKMGTVILLASIIIWALGYFPRKVQFSRDYMHEISIVESQKSISENDKAEKIGSLRKSIESEQKENSYIGRLGHLIEPVIQPLGFDWKLGVSIITGLAAKEIVVSTMGILYQADPGDGNIRAGLTSKLQETTYSTGKLKGQKVFTPLVAYGFMIFVLIYFPCIATIAAIRKESNLKWAAFIMGYTTMIAWIVAFLVHQIGNLL